MTLRKLVMPLFRPLSHLMLNYSNIIADKHRGRVLIDAKAYSQSAAVVLDEIRDHVEPLKRLSRPSDFLRHIAHQHENSNHQVRFDLGITHYLISNQKESLSIFLGLKAEILSGSPQDRERMGPLIEFILRQLQGDPRSLRTAIDAWRLQNIQLFDLQASCVPPLALKSV